MSYRGGRIISIDSDGIEHMDFGFDHDEPKKMTNADSIRAMTDEELAEFISGKARTFGEEYEGYMSALDWLEEEATE